MATPTETFVLAEMTHGKPHPAMNALAPDVVPAIKRIIRTYLGRNRAQQDCDLLSAECPGTFEVLTIEHIDD